MLYGYYEVAKPYVYFLIFSFFLANLNEIILAFGH